jgi:hypothetical protein
LRRGAEREAWRAVGLVRGAAVKAWGVRDEVWEGGGEGDVARRWKSVRRWGGQMSERGTL